MNQWIDDDKSIYLREDLTFNLIRFTNLGVTKADELRKNLWILNNQSIRRERKIIAITMKIFIMESTMRQYKSMFYSSYNVDLRFTGHKLKVEIDEDWHVYYDEEKRQIRQKLIENLCFTFIRITLDVENFDLNVKIAGIYSRIKDSSVKLAVTSLKEKFAGWLLDYMPSISEPLKQVKHFTKKIQSSI